MHNANIASVSRRQFIGKSAAISGAAAAVALPTIGLASTAVDTAASEISADLIMALGQRIAYDAVDALGTAELQLLYVDHAGPALDALRQGMEHTLGQLSSYTVMSRELAGQYGSLIAQATFHEPITGRQYRVEVPSSAISQLGLIAEVTRSSSLQKQAVMSASSDHFYLTA